MQECRNEGAISLAEVRSRVDPGRSGAFRAKVDAEGNDEQTVYYVSPYGSNGEGAFVAIPEVGTQVLVCKPTGSTSWYYMGTTFSSEPKEAVGGKIKDASLMPLERVDPEMYKARGVPLKYVFKSPFGAGITLCDEYNPEYFNRKTEITSTQNKKIMLHDGPAIDSITIDSGNGSKITLTDDPKSGTIASRAIEVDSVGPQKYICRESQTDIVVGAAGRELQLINNANGVPYGDTNVNSGNVNIQSKWKDINVFTQAEQGRIFIECLNETGANQQIVIETNGTGGGIIVKTKGTISMEAATSINLNSPNINISCNKFSVDAGGSVDIKAGGNANIDGSQIYLASDKASPTPATIADAQSTYNNIGVTTY